MRRSPRLAIGAALAALAITLPVPSSADDAGAPSCGETVTTLTGTVDSSDLKTYLLKPFVVPAGTARVEVSYTWDPIDAGVIDLGVWDARGTSGKAAFRTWSGSREGRIDKQMAPEVISPDRNERTVVPKPIVAGTWHVELGIAALDQPLTWRVELRCPAGPAAAPLTADPVDPTYVARSKPGWYAGDFHLHAYQSNTNGPAPADMVKFARAAGLDIIPVTEYVTPAHWDRLGATQRANPDELIWPGREVITYFGHMIVLSETTGVEYRVGHNGVTIGDIQRDAAKDGALVSIAHPTIFPPDAFGSACRGCYYQMLDQTDWASTTMMEVVTEGALAEFGGKDVANPFVRTAIELWEQELRAGHRLTAVSGSDDKTGEKYGKTSTMVYAEQLSRPAVDEALRRGHAYVRGLGKDSPTMDLSASTDAGTTAMFGDTLVADTATMKVTVNGATGDLLTIRRNGTEVERVPITSEPFVHETAISRSPDEGPLGTFWGAEVLDTTKAPGSELAVDVANPIFLADTARPEPILPRFMKPAAATSAAPPAVAGAGGGFGWTSRWTAAVIVAALFAMAGGAYGLTTARRRRASGAVVDD